MHDRAEHAQPQGFQHRATWGGSHVLGQGVVYRQTSGSTRESGQCDSTWTDESSHVHNVDAPRAPSFYMVIFSCFTLEGLSQRKHMTHARLTSNCKRYNLGAPRNGLRKAVYKIQRRKQTLHVHSRKNLTDRVDDHRRRDEHR